MPHPDSRYSPKKEIVLQLEEDGRENSRHLLVREAMSGTQPEIETRRKKKGAIQGSVTIEEFSYNIIWGGKREATEYVREGRFSKGNRDDSYDSRNRVHS